MDIKTIKARCHAIIRTNANTHTLSRDMAVDDRDELLSGSTRCGADRKVIDLATDKNTMTINLAGVEVALMSRSLETKFLASKNINNIPFPQYTSLWVTLEGTAQWYNIPSRIDILAIFLLVPGAVGVVNLKVALDRRRGRLLAGTLGVGKDNSHAFGSSQGKEEALAGLLNTRGVRLDKIAEPRSRPLRTIHTASTLARTTRLDNIVPMHPEDIRWLAVNPRNGRTENRVEEGSGGMVTIKLSVEASVPNRPIGELLEAMTSERLETAFLIGHAIGLESVSAQRRRSIGVARETNIGGETLTVAEVIGALSGRVLAGILVNSRGVLSCGHALP